MMEIKKRFYKKKILARIVTAIIPMIFKINPALTISQTCKRWLPKTIAFGGVPTGSINASETEKVTGIIIASGSMPISFDKAASRGRIIVVCAELDVSSLEKTTMVHIINISEV